MIDLYAGLQEAFEKSGATHRLSFKQGWFAALQSPAVQPVAVQEAPIAELIERKLAGEDTGPQIKARIERYADDYVGWCRFTDNGRFTACDSDAPGAFKVYRAASPAPAAPTESNQALIDWVVERWHAEVATRPMVNVHRRALDDTWRQVLRHLGVDHRARLGPTHDELRAEIGSKEWAAMNGTPAEQAAPTEPLTDEQIINIRNATWDGPVKLWGSTLRFARAILAARNAQGKEPTTDKP